MTRDVRSPILAATGCALALLLVGCGLKGPLSLPEKSGRVIIRGPQERTAPAVPPEATPAPADTPAPGPAAAPAPVEERQPPPSLPGGSPGTSRGG